MRMILTAGFLGLNATGVTLDGFKIDFEWTTIQFFYSKTAVTMRLRGTTKPCRALHLMQEFCLKTFCSIDISPVYLSIFL
jgi:hypothetical protein